MRQSKVRMAQMGEMLTLLHDGSVLLTQNIAWKLNVSHRTVFRYLAALRQQGYVINASKGHGGGIKLCRRKRTKA